jgi:hypothetical protein
MPDFGKLVLISQAHPQKGPRIVYQYSRLQRKCFLYYSALCQKRLYEIVAIFTVSCRTPATRLKMEIGAFPEMVPIGFSNIR